MQLLSVEECREIQLQIADEIHRICEEQGLRYFLSGGSLLGSVRHGGFIPWDDDFDVMMFRADYDALIEHFDEWKSEPRFEMLAPKLMNSPYYMAKVVDTTTYVKQTFARDEYSTGVWVDIFPMDGRSSTCEDTKKRMLRSKLPRYLAATDPKSGSNLPIKIAKRFVCPLVRLFVDPKKIVREMDDLVRRESAEQTDEVEIYCTVRKRSLKYKLEWFGQGTLYPFEDRMYWGPTAYDELLTSEFGDWRTPHEDAPHVAEAYRL